MATRLQQEGRATALIGAGDLLGLLPWSWSSRRAAHPSRFWVGVAVHSGFWAGSHRDQMAKLSAIADLRLKSAG